VDAIPVAGALSAGLLENARMRKPGPEALAPCDDGSLFESVNTPPDHARAAVGLN
jgi:hypothetical protein